MTAPTEERRPRRRRASDRRSRWIRFALDGQDYAFAIEAIREIVPVGTIYGVPGAPQSVLGVVNLRGQIVTVLSLRRLLGLPQTAPRDGARIIVLATADDAAGVLVDAVHGVVEIVDAQVEPPPEVGAQRPEAVSGVAQVGADSVLLLDAARLLPAQLARTGAAAG